MINMADPDLVFGPKPVMANGQIAGHMSALPKPISATNTTLMGNCAQTS